MATLPSGRSPTEPSRAKSPAASTAANGSGGTEPFTISNSPANSASPVIPPPTAASRSARTGPPMEPPAVSSAISTKAGNRSDECTMSTAAVWSWNAAPGHPSLPMAAPPPTLSQHPNPSGPSPHRTHGTTTASWPPDPMPKSGSMTLSAACWTIMNPARQGSQASSPSRCTPAPARPESSSATSVCATSGKLPRFPHPPRSRPRKRTAPASPATPEGRRCRSISRADP
jgi:hypothetical protein